MIQFREIKYAFSKYFNLSIQVLFHILFLLTTANTFQNESPKVKISFIYVFHFFTDGGCSEYLLALFFLL